MANWTVFTRDIRENGAPIDLSLIKENLFSFDYKLDRDVTGIYVPWIAIVADLNKDGIDDAVMMYRFGDQLAQVPNPNDPLSDFSRVKVDFNDVMKWTDGSSWTFNSGFGTIASDGSSPARPSPTQANFDNILKCATRIDIAAEGSPSAGDETFLDNLGAACDRGDLKDSYQTLKASDGPVHVVRTGLMIGADVDCETEGLASIDAMGDNDFMVDPSQNSVGYRDDEDGLPIEAGYLTNTGGNQTFTVPVVNNTGQSANMIAWIDWNDDGVFTPDEGISVPVPNGATSVTLNWIIPSGVAVQNKGLRLRLTTDPAITVNTPGGLASDGEVEDYLLSMTQDKDMDGVPDYADLDNDNDGILDSVETSVCSIPVFNKSSIIVSTQILDGSRNPQALVDGSEAQNYYFDRDQEIASKEVIKLEFPEDIVLTEIEFKTNNSEGVFDQSPGGVVKIQGSSDCSNWTDLSGNIIVGGTTTGVITNTSESHNFVFNNSNEYKCYRVLGVSGDTEFNYFKEIYFTAVEPNFCDTDGDGISNDCDLDSDGDGCPDALEGGSNPSLNNIVASALPGGNTDSLGFNGTAGPISLNLGTTVDADGVPIIVSGGQTIGSSQDPNIKSMTCDCIIGASTDGNPTATDKDGDGVNDVCDLDDDNDGILDSIECGTIVANADFNDNEGSINSSGISTSQFPGWATEVSFFAGSFVNGIEVFDGGIAYVTTDNSISKISQDVSFCQWDSILRLDIGWNNSSGGSLPMNFRVYLDGIEYAKVVTSFGFGTTASITYTNGASGNLTTIDAISAASTALTEWVIMFPSTVMGGSLEFDARPIDSGTTDDFKIDNVRLEGCKTDTDNDGICDFCDLDSDGDGCPDAVEGGGVFMMSDLVSSPISGGGMNLGNTMVDADGVPISAAGGQSSGSSRNASDTSACDDKDGDGVADVYDLDDDNDGILDKTEQACEKTGAWTEISPGVWESPMTLSGIKTRMTLGNYSQFWDAVAPASSTINATETDYTSDFGPITSADAINIRSGGNSGTATNASLTLAFFDVDNNAVTVVDPIIHIGGLGQVYSGKVTSASLELQGGLTQTLLSSNANLMVTETTIVDSRVGSASSAEKAHGSVLIKGAVSMLIYDVTQLNNAGSPTNNGTALDAFSIVVEGCARIDTDCDGITDDCDKDSDNDGCTDAWESGLTTNTADIGADSSLVSMVNFLGIPMMADPDSNGVVDYTLAMTGDRPSFQTFGDCMEMCCDGIDNNGDGIIDGGDTMACPDKDGDGVPNVCDLDDDNDGILDSLEGYCGNTFMHDWVAAGTGVGTFPFGPTTMTTTVMNLPAANELVNDVTSPPEAGWRIQHGAQIDKRYACSRHDRICRSC